MGRVNKFFKDVIFYTTSNFFANILNFITGIVVRRMLQPAVMGLFNELMLIFDYTRYSHFGIIDSLDRELPYYHGKKDYKKIETVKDIGFTFCLGISLCISACLVAYSFFIRPRIAGDAMLIVGIRVVSVMVILQLVNSLYIVVNRTRNNFAVISRYTILVAILDIVTKVFLVIKFGLYGLLWASVLTWILGLVYFYKASGERFRFLAHLPLGEIRRLFKIGFPIFLTGLVYMTLRNIDRIMIIRLLDRESLGFYTIGLMASVYIVQLPNLVYAVIFPRFYRAYGERGNIFEIKDLFIKPTIVFAYFFPILIGAAILTLPLLVFYILPAYTPGLFPAYLLLLGCSFMALVNMPGYLLIALHKQARMVLIGAIGIAVAVAIIYFLVKRLNLGLPGIAVGTGVSYFLYTTILISYAFKNYTKKPLAHLAFFAELYFPFVWVAVFLLVLRAFTFRACGNLSKDLLATFLKTGLFLAGCAPLAWYAARKTDILNLFKSQQKK